MKILNKIKVFFMCRKIEFLLFVEDIFGEINTFSLEKNYMNLYNFSFNKFIRYSDKVFNTIVELDDEMKKQQIEN